MGTKYHSFEIQNMVATQSQECEKLKQINEISVNNEKDIKISLIHLNQDELNGPKMMLQILILSHCSQASTKIRTKMLGLLLGKLSSLWVVSDLHCKVEGTLMFLQ